VVKKNILSVSCMENVQWRVAFKGKHYTINDCSLASPRNLARGVREGEIFRLIFDLVVLIHSNKRLENSFNFQEAR